MSLLGEATVLIWNDVIESAHKTFYQWHDKEHIPERLALPGFLRGRRYRGSGVTEWLTIYEATSIDAFTSPAYLERLDNPTPLTSSTVQAFRNTARSICRVVHTAGDSTGGHVLTLTLPSDFDALSLFVGQTADLLDRLGCLAAHLFVADEAASNIDTKESRERAFVVPSRVMLIETSTIEAAKTALEQLLKAMPHGQRAEAAASSGTFTLEISRLAAPLTT